jgi:hypothetical protein
MKPSNKEANRHSKLSIPQKRLHELEQVYQQALDIGPPLLTIYSEHFWHETPVTHQLQPCKAEEAFQQS